MSVPRTSPVSTPQQHHSNTTAFANAPQKPLSPPPPRWAGAMVCPAWMLSCNSCATVNRLPYHQPVNSACRQGFQQLLKAQALACSWHPSARAPVRLAGSPCPVFNSGHSACRITMTHRCLDTPHSCSHFRLLAWPNGQPNVPTGGGAGRLDDRTYFPKGSLSSQIQLASSQQQATPVIRTSPGGHASMRVGA